MKNTEFLSDWMWVPEWSAVDRADARIVYFRKEFELNEIPESYRLRISAASRYKLYINGRFVQEGPQKGTGQEWYVDEAEIEAFIVKGRNVAAVEVLRYPEDSSRRNDSICHTENAGLYVEDTTGGKLLSGSMGWKCRRAEGRKIVGEPFDPAPIHATECVSDMKPFHGWKYASYSDERWEDAAVYSIFDAAKAVSPFNLKDRTIPHMKHEECRFRKVVCVRAAQNAAEDSVIRQWNSFLRGEERLEIPAHHRQVVEISAGEEMCGFLLLTVKGGTGAKIHILSAECYGIPQPPIRTPAGERPAPPLKGDRTDFVNGELSGPEDCYAVGGYGTEEAPEEYEPFWFRTFRYLRIAVETKEEKITLLNFSYRATGYPLEVKTTVMASDSSFETIWDMSIRTLKRCMHETYIDCPFYEQLQYVMDSRAEILFTYMTAADDRLARQCMEAFRCSQRTDGMICASAPTNGTNVIPGFSIYYILMIHDHMMFFGDKDLVRRHFNCVDGILSFFDRNLSKKGLVAGVGGILFQKKYWSFIDWTAQWNDTIGVPTATLKGDGCLTMESLLYLYGLLKAAELAAYIGREGIAEEYTKRAELLSHAIRTNCMGRYEQDGKIYELIQDGPGVEEYSTHCQVFAILTGLVDAQKGKEMLRAVIGNKDIPQCSVSMRFYLFRALEAVDWYEKADEVWELWRKMTEDNLTTCVENDTDGRSDCHAWGAAILYELPAVYLGVRPAKPGFEEITVHPLAGHLTWAKGDVITPRGMVHVEWTKDNSTSKMSVLVSQEKAQYC
jgi:hypothetical protein